MKIKIRVDIAKIEDIEPVLGSLSSGIAAMIGNVALVGRSKDWRGELEPIQAELITGMEVDVEIDCRAMESKLVATLDSKEVSLTKKVGILTDLSPVLIGAYERIFQTATNAVLATPKTETTREEYRDSFIRAGDNLKAVKEKIIRCDDARIAKEKNGRTDQNNS